MKKVLVIFGPIGIGKTSRMALLKEKLKPLYPYIVEVPEPVVEWERIGILKEFYKDKKAKAYIFQTFAFATRVQCNRTVFEQHPNADLYIMERSHYDDEYIFSQMLYESGNFTQMEWEMYKVWCAEWRRLCPLQPTHMLYVDTDINLSLERILQRNRDGEIIDKDYQLALYNRYSIFIKTQCPFPMLKVNGNNDIFTDEHQQEFIAQVSTFLTQGLEGDQKSNSE